MKKRQVVIVGAGVGGSSAAFHMAKLGIDVLMVEKDNFPRDKPCGDGQVQSIHPLFKSMGIYEEIEKHGYKCPGTMFSDDRGEMYTYNYPEGEFAFCTARYIFDDIVNKAAVNAGVDYIENFEATEVIMRRGQACGIRGVHNGVPVEVKADLVVLADGGHSMMARQMGFYEENPDYVFYGIRGYFENVRGLHDAIEFHYPAEFFMPAGYVWMFPMSKTKANVGVFITEGGLERSGMTSEEILWWFRDNTKLGQERLGEAVNVGKLKGWRLPSGKHQKIYRAGIIAVGDAGNMIEPLYGGGIPHAMTAGVCAAKAAQECIEANDFSEEFLKRYSDYVDADLGGGYQTQEYLRKVVFGTLKDIRELIDYSQENFTGMRMSGGGGMMKFLVDRRGYTGPTKTAYSK
ncbi:MAG: NAD(P)/FAD-dependent oxidoreductase [Firmicutes bacterium]|nr:NAD(P)/FAD-dependent oxidoreductase [Bacillota bacterium]